MKENKDTFIVAYTSLALILLAFFICITSMATVTEEKVKKGICSIKKSFGVLEGKGSILGNDLASPSEYRVEGINERALDYLRSLIYNLNLSNEIKLGISKHGLVLALSEDLLFPAGSTSLNPKIYPILDEAANLIASSSNRVRIEGHTDSTPIRSRRFASNFELSAARALAVMKYFIKNKGLPRDRFIAVGCGEYHPLFPNDTKEHRAKNRRVWIILEGKPKRIRSNWVSIRGFIFKVREFFNEEKP